jgi:predicted aminopeptidase
VNRKREGPLQHARRLYVLRFTFGVLACGCLSACSPGYVLRAGYEEAKILWRRQPIEALLQRGDLDASTRDKLELVLAVRIFARDTLHLRVGGSYGTLARVDADQVVHVVSAAYQLQLQRYTWWFPIVGRVPYKGYFSESDAKDEAGCLERDGYDTYVRPSVAFSTLGWFADPLLSNLLRYDRATLASVIIHELLHNTSYIGGHADFDESFANFVGYRGAMLFFAGREEQGALEQATTDWGDALVFSDFLVRFTNQLRAAYGNGATLADRESLFRAAQAEFRTLPLHTRTYHEFATRPLNNAVILHDLMYVDRLQLFEDLLRERDGDLARLIQTVLDAVRERAGDPFVAVEALRRSAAAPALQRTLTLADASGLDGTESPNAVADGEQKDGKRQRRGRHQRRCDAGLCKGRQRRLPQPTHEPRVDRPGLEHDHRTNE